MISYIPNDIRITDFQRNVKRRRTLDEQRTHSRDPSRPAAPHAWLHLSTGSEKCRTWQAPSNPPAPLARGTPSQPASALERKRSGGVGLFWHALDLASRAEIP